jgi:hypothetical protein
MTKRATLSSAVLIWLLLGALIGAFIWLALKGDRNTLMNCEIRPKLCSMQ